MTGSVSLPLWLEAVVFVLAAVALFERLLAPGVKWLVRRRVARVLDEVDVLLSIRIQLFELTKRQVLVDHLLNDPAVLDAVEAASREEGHPRDGVYRARLGAAEGLKAVPEGATVVFLMNHRSDRDSVLVSYLVAEKTALSHAVGEWARVWPFQALFRAMGACFIRRDSKNPLYRKVLERDVAMATAEGVTQAVSPEGVLTWDGRLRPPRLGILDDEEGGLLRAVPGERPLLESYAGGVAHLLPPGEDAVRP